jgi:hypothetical protein
MRTELIHLRISDFQIVNGVTEYSIEVTLPGQYNRRFVGTCVDNLSPSVSDALRQALILLGIPPSDATPEKTTPAPAMIPQPLVFFMDEHGKKQPMFAGKANAKFEAQVIRNGKVVEE